MPITSSRERKILNSWKEIAAYTGRGVRTIQRYEAVYGFPVHRPAKKRHSSVMAFTDEVDAWLASTLKNRVPLAFENLEPATTLETIEQQIQTTRAALERLEEKKIELISASTYRERSTKGTAA